MIPAVQRRLVFETAEGVTFSHRLAGPFLRGLALVVDFTVVQTVASALLALLSALHYVSRDLAVFLSILVGFVMGIGYWIFFELRWRGQTPGKRLFGLRVMDVDGRRLAPYQVVLRNLLRVVDQIPLLYLVGAATGFLTARWQRVGDLVAGTVVVHEAEPLGLRRIPPREADHGHNSLRDKPQLAKRLRQALTPMDYRIARSALLRRNELGAQARLEVFSELAQRIRSLVTIPAEVLEGMSDENLVRSVVEIVEEGT